MRCAMVFTTSCFLLLMVLVHRGTCTKDKVDTLKSTLRTVTSERDTLRERVTQLEQQEQQNENTIQGYEVQLKTCEEENSGYENKIKSDLKEYMEIHLSQRDVEKAIQQCQKEKVALESERDEIQQAIDDLKKSFMDNMDDFQTKLKEFAAADRDVSWNVLARLFGECWIQQRISEIRRRSSGRQTDIEDIPDDDLNACKKFKEDVEKYLEVCSGKLSKCRAIETNVEEEQQNEKTKVESLELKAVQLSAEVEELQKGSDCECESPEEIEKTKSMLTHYIDQFHTCKLQKQSHKVLKWYMAKELVSLKHKVANVSGELASVRKSSKKDLKALTKVKKEMDQLTKDFNDVTKLYEKTDKDLAKKTKEYDKCSKDREHTEFVQKGTEMVMNQLEGTESQLKKEKKKYTKEAQKALDEAMKNRMYFVVCLIIIFAILVVHAYFYTKQTYEAYKERLREEKSSQRKERREGKGKKLKRN